MQISVATVPRPSRTYSEFRHTSSGLELLVQGQQEGAAHAELRGADADPGAVADLVPLIKQIDDVEAQFETLEDPGIDLLQDA